MIFASCNSSDNDLFIIDTAIDMSVKDINGNDLLNPNNSNSLNEDEFKSKIQVTNATFVFVNNWFFTNIGLL